MDRSHRQRAAADMVANPAFADLIAELVANIMDELQATAPAARDRREQLYWQQNAIKDVAALARNWANDKPKGPE